MPKFTVYRTHSPTYQKKQQKSILKPVEAIRTPGFTLGLPQATIIYPHTESGRYRVRTVLAPRVERKVIRSAAKTPDLDGLWPRHSIPSKSNSSHSRLLKHGIKIKKITQMQPQYEPKYASVSHVIKLSADDFKQRTSIKKQPDTLENSLSDFTEGHKNNASMDDQYNYSGFSHLPSIMVPVQLSTSPGIRRALTSTGDKKKAAKKVEKISVKEVMRDKEWTAKARSQILKDFYLHVNWSNGVLVNAVKEGSYTVRYYLGIGNNSKLVKQIMSSRWWWVRVGEEEKESANFVWTQWKEWGFINSLPCLEKGVKEVEPTSGFSIDSKTKYIQSSPNNLPCQAKFVDITPLGFNLITKSESYTHLVTKSTFLSADLKIHNKLEHNYHLSNKKALFYNLVKYYNALGKDPFSYLPLTFHIKTGESDPEFTKFQEKFNEFETALDSSGRKIANLWIIKPGENTNRGSGISVASDLSTIRAELRSNPCPNSGPHTFILQKYIERPFLVNKRKFDIRCYSLLTCVNGILQGYFYQEGYLRTSSKNFSLASTSKYVHLTNDAVQKKSDDYGKFEKANKMSYIDFQRYLDNHNSQANFLNEILPEIRSIIKDTIQAVYLKIDINKRAHSFEVFGYDFLLDADLKPWILEVNTNPCLELSSPHLARIIPAMLDNALRIALDPLFPEPLNVKKVNTEVMAENKFELIFHESIDGKKLMDLLGSGEKIKELCEVDNDLLEMVNEESEGHPESEGEC